MNPVGQTLIAMEPRCVYVLLRVGVHKLAVTHCNEATGAYLLLKSLQAVTNCCEIAYVGGRTSLRNLQSDTCRAGRLSRNVENRGLFIKLKACKSLFLFQFQHSHFEKHVSVLVSVDSSVLCQILTYYITGYVISRVSEVVLQSHLSVRDMCTNWVCPVMNM